MLGKGYYFRAGNPKSWIVIYRMFQKISGQVGSEKQKH
jgi:hypothetical protein